MQVVDASTVADVLDPPTNPTAASDERPGSNSEAASRPRAPTMPSGVTKRVRRDDRPENDTRSPHRAQNAQTRRAIRRGFVEVSFGWRPSKPRTNRRGGRYTRWIGSSIISSSFGAIDVNL